MEEELQKSDLPFKILGRSQKGLYHFIGNDTGTLITMLSTQMTTKAFIDLAPRQFWVDNFCKYVKVKGVCEPTNIIDELKVIDFLIGMSKREHFKMSNFRGSGFWMDKNRIVYNPGKKKLHVISENEKGFSQIEEKEYNEFKSDFYYTVSDRNFPNPPKINNSKIASNEDGEKLKKLFYTQSFKTKLEAKMLIGWTLMAPFGTVLNWRPHIWLSGQPKKGKSWLLENVIGKMGGESALLAGSGTTYAALRRDLGENGGYAVIDEMEGRTKDIRDHIEKIMELVKNASSDGAGASILVINGKNETFFVNQMFCLASVVTQMHGQAIKSRIFNCELNNRVNMDEKKKATRKILADGFFDDKQKFFNRTLLMIHKVLKSKKRIDDVMAADGHDNRFIDVTSPCLAAFWHSTNTDIIDEKHAIALSNECSDYIEMNEKEENDYDTFFHLLFNSIVRVTKSNGHEEHTIGALITKCWQDETYRGSINNMGIKFVNGIIKVDNPNKKIYYGGMLAIAVKSPSIEKIMTDNNAYFGTQYNKIIKDHPAAKMTKNVRFDTQRHSIIFDVEILCDMYFNDDDYEMIKKEEI